jgi:heat shock protein HslJ
MARNPTRLVLAVALVTGCAAAGPPGPLPADLTGTAWRARTVAGQPVPEAVAVTMEFPEAGRIAGRSACNRYSGPIAEVDGKLAIGPLASTRMACPPPESELESLFLRALEQAERLGRDNSALVLHSAGGIAPSRFVPFTPP